MSDSIQRTPGTDAPDAEVELSAQDLLELSNPCDDNKRTAPELQSAKITPAASAARSNEPVSRVFVSAAVVAGVIGALYVVMAPTNDVRQAQIIQPPQPQAQLLASAPTMSEAEPVRFANPFDANEVFEFPAGTSQAEARDAVADILMARAMERQRQFDARVSNNR